MAKHTINLSQKAEKQLADMMYSMMDATDKGATMSQCVSEALEELWDFEHATGDQILNWLEDNIKGYKVDYKGSWAEHIQHNRPIKP